MKRFKGFSDARANAQGLAALITFEFTDGTKLPIEFERASMAAVLRGFLNTTSLMGDYAANPRPFLETTPAQAVQIPTEDLHVVTEGGAVWLFLRVGSEDLALALPDPRAARAVGQALLDKANQSNQPRTST
jgi:hypothetical protein